MLKASLRISAVLSLIAISFLVALLYLPATNHIAKQIIQTLGGDHVVHVLVGCLLPICLAFLTHLYYASVRLQLTYWFACLVVFGVDELLQGLAPLRKQDLQDFLMSALGWAIGFVCWWLFWFFRNHRSRH